MGLFNFVKDAGEKLWDAVTGQHDKDDQAKKVQEHLNKTGIPDADKVNVTSRFFLGYLTRNSGRGARSQKAQN